MRLGKDTLTGSHNVGRTAQHIANLAAAALIAHHGIAEPSTSTDTRPPAAPIMSAALHCPTPDNTPFTPSVFSGKIVLESGEQIRARQDKEYCGVTGLLEPNDLSLVNPQLGALYLYPAAAVAADAMDEAYAADHNGEHLPIGRTYATFEDQWLRHHANGGVTPEAGHDDHGTGLDIDVAGPAEPGAEAVYEWVGRRAGEFGFTQGYRALASPTDQTPIEPWHLSYTGSEYNQPLTITLSGDFAVVPPEN